MFISCASLGGGGGEGLGRRASKRALPRFSPVICRLEENILITMGTRLGSPVPEPGLWSRKRKGCRGGGHFLMRFQTSLSSERSGDMKLATIEYRKGLGVRGGGGSSKLIGLLEVFLGARVRWRKPQVPDCQELRR